MMPFLDEETVTYRTLELLRYSSLEMQMLFWTFSDHPSVVEVCILISCTFKIVLKNRNGYFTAVKPGFILINTRITDVKEDFFSAKVA